MGWLENPGCSSAELGQWNYQRTVEQLVPENVRRFFPPVKCEPNTLPRCFFPLPAEKLNTFMPPFFQFPTLQNNPVMPEPATFRPGDWSADELTAAMTLVEFAKIHEKRETHERRKERQRIRRRQRLQKKREERLAKARELEMEQLSRQQMRFHVKQEPADYPVAMEVDPPGIPMLPLPVNFPANLPANVLMHQGFPRMLPFPASLPTNAVDPRVFSLPATLPAGTSRHSNNHPRMLPPVITPTPVLPQILPSVLPKVIPPATPDPPLFIHIKQEIKQEPQEGTSSTSPQEPEPTQSFVEQLLEGKFTADFYAKLFS